MGAALAEQRFERPERRAQTGSSASTPVAANNTSRVARNFVRSSSFGSFLALAAACPRRASEGLEVPRFLLLDGRGARPGFASRGPRARGMCSFRGRGPSAQVGGSK